MAVGRTDSFQELITLLEATFGETILGSDINLVKHLFYHLKSDGREFSFDYEDRKLLALVEDIEEDSVILDVPDFIQRETLRAKIYFEIMNVLYSFEVLIVDSRRELVRIRIPNELQAAQFRQNERIPVDDLFMNYIILYRSLQGGGREIGRNIYVERRFGTMMREIRKDNPSLKLINIMLTENLLFVSQDYELRLFHQVPEDQETFLDTFVKKYNHSIYIGNIADLKSYFSTREVESLRNFRDYFLDLVAAEGEDKANEFFRELQHSESRDFIVSYVVCPIRLFTEVIGYLRVYTSALDKYSITEQQAQFIHELSEIVSYAFTKVYIRLDNYRFNRASTKILDISMKGLLFEIEEKKIFDYLRRHNVIKMFIPMKGKTLQIRGEVVRYRKVHDELYHLGVNFFDSNPDDLLILEEYMYDLRRTILSE